MDNTCLFHSFKKGYLGLRFFYLGFSSMASLFFIIIKNWKNPFDCYYDNGLIVQVFSNI